MIIDIRNKFCTKRSADNMDIQEAKNTRYTISYSQDTVDKIWQDHRVM